MCGILGVYILKDEPLQTCDIDKALSKMAHRGPDAAAVWSRGRVTLGHRRLAIVDLSVDGNQPMHSASGRYTIVFNGEIYNFKDIRSQISSQYVFRGHSDTEVLLAAVEIYGLDWALEQSNGMFAFALFDHQTEDLYLARDRIGKKPCYYGQIGGRFIFASELKAITALFKERLVVDSRSVNLFLDLGYIPSPFSIYHDIAKLEPGHLLRVNRQGIVSKTSFWSLEDVLSKPLLQDDEASLINNLKCLLENSVQLRLNADVEVASFLSGGIDSSLVTAMMVKHYPGKVKSFSIGFAEAEFDESRYARDVAKHLGTDHYEHITSAQEMMGLIEKLPSVYDEPFADPSQIPTLLVSELASKHVKVVLSGDGGDEFFCGYNRYFWGAKIWQALRLMPSSIRPLVSGVLAGLSSQMMAHAYQWVQSLLPVRYQLASSGDKFAKLGRLVGSQSDMDLYIKLTSFRDHGLSSAMAEESWYENLVRGGKLLTQDFQKAMMLSDQRTYLPDDILVKVDRATMHHSLEARAPLLDYRVLEYGWQLPMSMKYRDGQGKWILRQILYDYVPRELIDRPKMGFGIPLNAWLRTSLREMACDLLSEAKLKNDANLNKDRITKMLVEHMAGRRQWGYQLWNVMMYRLWQDSSN